MANMKRVDMVDHIADMIHENRRHTMTVTSDDLAEMILTLCETKGMLPPIEPDRTVADLDLGVPEWETEE